ncbi:citrate synthase/methylcitrate synthase [Psychrobacillus glaciei]|uniref:Citrate synthase n=1 Tax=Psychrobacillus glaciei TaxID=2283160 RepID=A0A5J6SS14_9BACI|nr:citrate/2-methylcitrate synthase [Psychrobacillus glaciei]QFG00822.1 citrate synthase/methylcitrate synthase [Psychrobacillus glaciei]
MFQKGLKGVVAVHTKISLVDGENGVLRYHGTNVKELVLDYSFEQVAYFLLNDKLPTEVELQQFNEKLKEGRYLPLHVQKVMDALPKTISIMDAMRTAISTFSTAEFLQMQIMEQAIVLTGALPVVISRHYRKQLGLPIIEANDNFSHTENYLWMLNGTIPTSTQVEALETYLKLTMEHGLNASTFAARVTVSTESDLPAAVTSAIGTMKGPLHGGAPSEVLNLLEEIKDESRIQLVIEEKIKNGEKVMGFGHRIYKTEDPRSILLREACLRLQGSDPWLDLATKAEKEIIGLLDKYKPGRKLYTNVEFYAAAIMRSIDMPAALFTPTFSVARIVGWSAHVIEQVDDQAIFRPQSLYVGKIK